MKIFDSITIHHIVDRKKNFKVWFLWHLQFMTFPFITLKKCQTMSTYLQIAAPTLGLVQCTAVVQLHQSILEMSIFCHSFRSFHAFNPVHIRCLHHSILTHYTAAGILPLVHGTVRLRRTKNLTYLWFWQQQIAQAVVQHGVIFASIN